MTGIMGGMDVSFWSSEPCMYVYTKVKKELPLKECHASFHWYISNSEVLIYSWMERASIKCQGDKFYLLVRAAGNLSSHYLYGAHAVLGEPRRFFFLESHRRMNRERGRLAAACSIHLSERILWRSDVESLTRQRRNRWQMNRKHSSLHYIITHYAQNFPSAIERLISFWLDIEKLKLGFQGRQVVCGLTNRRPSTTTRVPTLGPCFCFYDS